MSYHARILPPHRRALIEAEIEQHLARVTILLARLDRADAAFEDIEDDDPSGDSIDQRGEALSNDGSIILATRPLYAVDQRSGPINFEAARREHKAREMGLVRSASGGWRMPS